MPNTTGADARQSRTLQKLDHFDPAGVTALAAAALLLLDAVNAGALVASDQVELALFSRTRKLIDCAYLILDAVHGSSDQIPAALASLLNVAECEVHCG